ncbi:cysteine dioxygenase [Streptomyces sp. NPDC048172]|uniref:cysteine dioxygenase family protein n=1 Tax=Streptomyces sp. NPDC048172 TaxID=3365505 RepID=UPI00371E2097
MAIPTDSAPAQAESGNLRALVASVREALREAVRESTADGPELRAARVAERLRPFLSAPALLAPEQREGDPAGYRQHLLHAEPAEPAEHAERADLDGSVGAFSVVALVWLPGQETPVHDHVAWCATGVYEGCEDERRFRPAGGALEVAGRRVNRAGDVSSLAPPGDIHLVRNPGPGRAVSLHVYGADLGRLGTSVRRVYPPGALRDGGAP